MSFKASLLLALKLIRRDWRSGELTILALALVVAVAGSTAVGLFGHRLTRTMERQAAEFLAADLVVSAHEPYADAWFEKAAAMGLAATKTVEFPNVLVENGELLLTGAKAVGESYPLRGAVRTTLAGLDQETRAAGGPAPGTAWVDARVLNTLRLSLGDSVALGEKNLKLERILTHEPDRRGDLFSLSPRVMFNLADLEGTGLIRLGSNAHYYALFAGDGRQLLAFKRWLKPLLHPGQKIVDVHEDRPEVGNALSRAERYLGLSSTLIVLIAGVAIAMSARRYSERHYDLTALMKCLGARERDVLAIHLCQYLLVGGAASLAGCVLGYLAQEGVAIGLRGILPQELLAPAWYAPLFGMGVGLLVLLGFALPPVLGVKRLPPLRVLRRDLAPLPSSAWTVYGLALATLGVLVWHHTGDGRMTAIVLGVTLATLIVAGFGILALIRLLRRLSSRLSLPGRLGLQNLTRKPQVAMVQILAFGLTFAAMLVSLLARTELIQEWRRQLPEHAPNYFALNLFAEELPEFQDFLRRSHIETNQLYPIVRGRITAVNGVDVHALAHKDSQGEAAINRDLSLTWSAAKPADNGLVEGQWWDAAATPGQISVEAKLAESLGIRVGDVLEFSITGQQRQAVVGSLRAVRWDTMRPNFYVIFSPGSLEGFPARWLTSFYLAPGNRAESVDLAKRFPSMTLLEVEQLVKQVQTILREISLSIDFVLVFALAAGFAVLFAAVRASLDERLRENALLRAMGAGRGLLRKSLSLEFAVLGGMAGLLAACATEAVAWTLFDRTFQLVPRIHWEIWFSAPLAGAFTVGLAGYWHTRILVKSSPLKILREI